MEVLRELAEQLDCEDGTSGVQANPDQAQESGHGAEDMEDLVELRVLLPESRKVSNPQHDNIKPYLGESNKAPLQIGEDLPYYL